MSNEIRIQPPAERIPRGKPMTVPVTVVLDGPLKVRGIHAKFHGAEQTKAIYTTTSTDSKGRVTTHTHTAVEHVDITTHRGQVRNSLVLATPLPLPRWVKRYCERLSRLLIRS